jgi:signal transduction histidine kinase
MIGPADRDRLAILVHEVRSPVAALVAIGEAFRDAEPPARRTLVPLAIAACAGIERIVSDATVDSVVREPVDVGGLVEERVRAATLRGEDVRVELEPDLPRVDADPQRLRQALDNLISNAVTHAGGQDVIVAARSGDGAVLVSVSDRGPGIPAEEQRRIFEAGVRLDLTRPGSGLGLALARSIAEAHGGALAVDSQPGEGATFTLTLPLEPAGASD